MMSTEIEFTDLTEIVGDFEVSCDYADRMWHNPAEQRAQWIATLTPCVCGAGGDRLICAPCHDLLLVDDWAAFECQHCEEITFPPRMAFSRFERLS